MIKPINLLKAMVPLIAIITAVIMLTHTDNVSAISTTIQRGASNLAALDATPTLVPVAPILPTPAYPIPNGGFTNQTFNQVMAFVDQTGNVGLTNTGAAVTLVTNDSTLNGPQAQPSKSYRQFRWSPDGTKLLYTEDVSRTLYLLVSGQAPLPVVSGIAAGYPAAWSPDGTKIAYVIPTPNSPNAKQVFQVQVITLTGTAMSAPQFGASFTTQGGCGGLLVPDPAETLYQREFGSGLVLEWTNAGFVYSLSCLGAGIGLVNQNNPPTWTIPDVARVAIFADKAHAVGIKAGPNSSALDVIDLTTGAVIPLSVATGVDQVSITPDGQTILYSTITPDQVIPVNPGGPAQQLQQFGPMAQAQEYIATLWRVPTAGGSSTLVSRYYARGIGNISIASDNSGVVYSLSTSDADLVKAINQGATAQQARAHMPYVEVLYAALNGNAPIQTLLLGSQPRLGGNTTFTAVAASPANNTSPTLVPTVAPPPVNPPTLTPSGSSGPGPALFPASIYIGEVVTTSNTLNMRQSPSTAAALLRVLSAGSLVTVVSGPQLAEGYRWWFVRTSDGAQGWVVDQIGQVVMLTAGSSPVGPGLVVGGQAVVASGVVSLPMYAVPGQASDGPDAGVIATLKGGDIVRVVAGPQIFNNIRWWHVANGGGTDGWVYEQSPQAPGGRTLLLPLVVTPTNIPPAALVVGGQAVVASGVVSLPMWAVPGQATDGPSPNIVATLKGGDVVRVVAGPQVFNNIRWWHVANGGGTDGWVYEQSPQAPGGRTLLLPTVVMPTNLPPPALVVGGQAVVAAGVVSLPMYAVPGQASNGPGSGQVATLKAGDIVKIIAGPQVFSNIRWWHVANGGGTDGWVYEESTNAPGGQALLVPIH